MINQQVESAVISATFTVGAEVAALTRPEKRLDQLQKSTLVDS